MAPSDHTQHTNQEHATHAAHAAHVATGAAIANTPAPPLALDREFKFSFKKQKIMDDTLGMEVKRPPVTLNVPIPTFEGLVEALMSGDKVSQFVLDLVEEAIKDQVRSQLSDTDRPVMRQSELDTSKLTLSYIANMPKSERTGGGISKETWDEFEKDYIETMGPIRGSVDKAAKAAKLFTGRYAQCRTEKNVLKFLQEQLATWSQNSAQVEEFADVFKYLDDRATDLINKDDPDHLASL